MVEPPYETSANIARSNDDIKTINSEKNVKKKLFNFIVNDSSYTKALGFDI